MVMQLSVVALNTKRVRMYKNSAWRTNHKCSIACFIALLYSVPFCWLWLCLGVVGFFSKHCEWTEKICHKKKVALVNTVAYCLRTWVVMDWRRDELFVCLFVCFLHGMRAIFVWKPFSLKLCVCVCLFAYTCMHACVWVCVCECVCVHACMFFACTKCTNA